jgi:hypothetical protein
MRKEITALADALSANAGSQKLHVCAYLSIYINMLCTIYIVIYYNIFASLA